jgi:hypothetical protein
MKGLRYLVCGVALVASVGASPASAANWSPLNQMIHGTQLGTGKLTTNLGGVIQCTAGTTDLTAVSATPTVASTTTTTNPVQFTGCSALGFGMTVSTHGTWKFAAVNTTTVNATVIPTVPGGAVATITTTLPECRITVGEATINGNTWNTTSTTLTTNSTTSFPITATEACATYWGTSVTLHTTFSVPAAMIQ